MAKVGFDGADDERFLQTPHGFAVDRRQRAHLDGVAQRSTGAVRFDIADVQRGHLAAGKCRADHLLLSHAIGNREGTGVAVVIDRRAADQRVDAVAGRERIRKTFEDDHAAAFTAAKAVGRGIERLGVTVRRERARLG